MHREATPPPTENGCFCTVINGEVGCREQCLNYRENVECVPWLCECGGTCGNQRFQRRSYVTTMPFLTEKKGWGLLTLEDIPPGRFVIEYVGEVINAQELERRMAEGAGRPSYFLALSNTETIDASKMGNLSRFINHSCEPNCTAERWLVLNELCVGIFAAKFIAAGTELTFDYNFAQHGGARQRCYCGSSTCKGFI